MHPALVAARLREGAATPQGLAEAVRPAAHAAVSDHVRARLLTSARAALAAREPS